MGILVYEIAVRADLKIARIWGRLVRPQASRVVRYNRMTAWAYAVVALAGAWHFGGVSGRRNNAVEGELVRRIANTSIIRLRCLQTMSV